MNKIFSIKETAKLLNIQGPRAGDKCRRLLINLEESKQIQIIFKRNKNYHYTTESSLKNALPEFFKDDKVTFDTVKSLKETVIELVKKVNSLNAEINILKGKSK